MQLTHEVVTTDVLGQNICNELAFGDSQLSLNLLHLRQNTLRNTSCDGSTWALGSLRHDVYLSCLSDAGAIAVQ